MFLVPAAATESVPAVDVKSLHAKIGALTLENDFLEGALSKADCLAQSADLPRVQFAITKQADVLCISRGSFYYLPRPVPRMSTSQSCGVSTGCIWSPLSPARGCSEACWSLRGARSAVGMSKR